MEKKSKNNLIRCLIFLGILFVLVLYVLQVFGFPAQDEARKTFNTFYNEKEDTYDAVYLGSSAANRYWIGPLAYEEEGIAVGSLATTSQPLVLTRYIMEEATKTQHPKLFILELRWAYKSAENIEDAAIRRVTDCMKMSKTRINAIRAAIDFAMQGENNVSEEVIEYYISFFKYHDRWKDNSITGADFTLTSYESDSKGYYMSPGNTFAQKEQVPTQYSDYSESRLSLYQETEDVLNDLLDYCDSIDAEVLFVLSPFSATKEEQIARLNTAIDIVESRGYDVLNCNTDEAIEAIGIDWETDFYNARHTNCLGAEKYTRYLTEYICSNYDLEDHRGDEDYDSWEEAYQYYLNYVSEGKSKMQTK